MEEWNVLLERFKQVTDKLNMPIDTGIFETVVALNALDITTAMSCEGHTERGTPYPWVDIEAPEVLTGLRPHVNALKKEQGENTPEIERLRAQAKLLQFEERKKIISYLTEFYKERLVAFDRRIIIVSIEWMGRTRIKSQGADFQEFRSPQECLQKLQEYQEEMQTFTQFLKASYFTHYKVAPDLLVASTGVKITTGIAREVRRW